MTTPTTVNIRLQLRADTAANWAAANPTLLANEVGLETDTKKLKVGSGSTAWNSLAYFPSIVSGGTVLGNLEIGSTGTLTFEGSTADGFETTLAVTNPTADRTITLPNQSGTVVVSGNASIVNADIAANAEIAVSKLANGTANQVIVTDGTNVSWSDDLTLAGNLTVNGTTTTISTQNLLVEDKNIIIGDVATPTDVTADGGGITLKGATDKTINWVDATDAWTSSERFSVPLGSAASPSLTFTGDTNTGVFSPSADALALSTGGSERLRITSAGLVGIGTSSPSTNTEINAALDTGASLGLNEGQLSIGREANSGGAVRIGYDTTNNFGFISSGRVGTSWDKLILNAGGGNVGIGTTSPQAVLHLERNQAAESGLFINNTDAGGYVAMRLGNSDRGTNGDHLIYGGTVLGLRSKTGTAITFEPAGSERARIDSSGRLLVGTSTAVTTTNALTAKLQAQGANAFDTGIAGGLWEASSNPFQLHLVKSRGATVGTHTVVQNGDGLGRIVFGGSDGTDFEAAAYVECLADGTPGANDMPGRLVFSTTADGASSPTERMRITSGGVVSINDASPNANYFLNVAYEPSSKGCVYLEDFAFYTSQHALVINNLDTNNARTMSDVRFERNGTEVGFIKINPGSVTYSTTSDYRVKENVTPLVDAISRLNQLQVKRFNFISDPGKTVDGFIAHEAQAVVPEAVSGVKDETKDLGNITDADGRIVATAVDEPLPEHLQDGHTWTKTHTVDVHQGIDQSKLVPLLTAALQEAIGRIELLEAEVAALKAQ